VATAPAREIGYERAELTREARPAESPGGSRRHAIGFWLAGYGRTALRRQLGIGMGLLAIGLIAVTAAIWQPSLPLLLVGGALGGAGAGAVFKGSISTVLGIAPAQSRGEALAGLFLAAYLGLAVPVLGLGLATQAFSTRTALVGFSAVLAVVIAAVARRLLQSGR